MSICGASRRRCRRVGAECVATHQAQPRGCSRGRGGSPGSRSPKLAGGAKWRRSDSQSAAFEMIGRPRYRSPCRRQRGRIHPGRRWRGRDRAAVGLVDWSGGAVGQFNFEHGIAHKRRDRVADGRFSERVQDVARIADFPAASCWLIDTKTLSRGWSCHRSARASATASAAMVQDQAICRLLVSILNVPSSSRWRIWKCSTARRACLPAPGPGNSTKKAGAWSAVGARAGALRSRVTYNRFR